MNSQLALLFRDRRDQLYTAWQASLPGAISDEYREVLDSPVGANLLRTLIEDLIALSQAEVYERKATWRRIAGEAAVQASRRAAMGFTLADLIAALQLVRRSMWKVLIDALVTGDLPTPGEVMDEMAEIDAFIDRLVQVEILGYLRGGEGGGGEGR